MKLFSKMLKRKSKVENSIDPILNILKTIARSLPDEKASYEPIRPLTPSETLIYEQMNEMIKQHKELTTQLETLRNELWSDIEQSSSELSGRLMKIDGGMLLAVKIQNGFETVG